MDEAEPHYQETVGALAECRHDTAMGVHLHLSSNRHDQVAAEKPVLNNRGGDTTVCISPGKNQYSGTVDLSQPCTHSYSKCQRTNFI